MVLPILTSYIPYAVFVSPEWHLVALIFSRLGIP